MSNWWEVTDKRFWNGMTDIMWLLAFFRKRYWEVIQNYDPPSLWYCAVTRFMVDGVTACEKK